MNLEDDSFLRRKLSEPPSPPEASAKAMASKGWRIRRTWEERCLTDRSHRALKTYNLILT